MSYTYSNRIRYEDTSDLDSFGRLRVSSVTSLIELKHVHDNLPLLVDQKVSGVGASATWSFANSQVAMAVTNNNEYVIRQTRSRGIYQPGKGQIMEASFGNFALQTNVIKRVGYFSATTVAPYNSGFDGYFLESDGQTGVISFQIWKNGTLTYSSPSTSWLTEDYDASLLVWTDTQLMVTDFQWLGVGRVRFGMVIDGTFRLFTVHTGTNNLTEVYMRSPNQPVRYEIRSVGGAGTFNMICSQVSLEGSINNLQQSSAINGFNQITCGVAGTYPLLGYRLNSGYVGANITLSDVQSLIGTSGTDCFFTIQLNPTLSGALAFSNITNTPIDYALGNGTVTVTAAGTTIAAFLGSGSAAQVDNFEFKDNVLRPGIGIDGTQTEVWLCATTTANNVKLRSSANLSFFI